MFEPNSQQRERDVSCREMPRHNRPVGGDGDREFPSFARDASVGLQ